MPVQTIGENLLKNYWSETSIFQMSQWLCTNEFHMAAKTCCSHFPVDFIKRKTPTAIKIHQNLQISLVRANGYLQRISIVTEKFGKNRQVAFCIEHLKMLLQMNRLYSEDKFLWNSAIATMCVSEMFILFVLHWMTHESIVKDR